jgi:beta-glucosidase
MKGSHVVQLYVEYPTLQVTTPRRQFKGFARTENLEPGKEQTVHMRLSKYSVSYWDVERHEWAIQPGWYKLFVGSSSEDLTLDGEVVVEKQLFWVNL